MARSRQGSASVAAPCIVLVTTAVCARTLYCLCGVLRPSGAVVAFCNRRSTWASRRKPTRVTESPRLWCCSLHDNLETKKIP